MEIDTQRRTGRTTRMLQEAAKASEGGGRVAVVLPFGSMARWVVKRLRELAPDAAVAVVVVEPDAQYAPESFRGRDPVRVFYDHTWHEMRAKVWRHASLPMWPA